VSTQDVARNSLQLPIQCAKPSSYKS
jgi:hypothetical protein